MQQNPGTVGKKPQTEKDDKGHGRLSHHDAEVASPEDGSLCGEEDPGSALESLVDNDDDKDR
ncbi:hypothetical protein [Lacimicrobium alkaliphilum]|uniref:Uncharacterized protein n=1 Tax=Lacimicrobium alkaliphilum TaxID=1526571 RepID=A0A0U3AAC9_9ALTE|nr:hypothetical protein [Lacimicrobium alkaliphilum]ALS97966.1 hypothetical protein AT746_06600 [Lacimicrobium alkaliphilum]